MIATPEIEKALASLTPPPLERGDALLLMAAAHWLQRVFRQSGDWGTMTDIRQEVLIRANGLKDHLRTNTMPSRRELAVVAQAGRILLDGYDDTHPVLRVIDRDRLRELDDLLTEKEG